LPISIYYCGVLFIRVVDLYGYVCAYITGILSLWALVLSSALIGGLRRPEAHITSNTLCFLASITGFICSILFGAVLYPVSDLSQDFAIFLAGWWLIFFAAIIGLGVTSYYTNAQNEIKVTPMVPIAQQQQQPEQQQQLLQQQQQQV